MLGPPTITFVIPVYNGSATVGDVVKDIQEHFRGEDFEIVLVNDGSQDDSESTCRELRERYPGLITYVHLAHNFGEHAAVLAGLNHAQGDYVAVLDDDGQNPPREVRRLFEEIQKGSADVVYGRYRSKRHGWLRNLGSWFNDAMANVMLKKPRDLYLSSFKIMNRFLVDQITKYKGPFPYIDGLILRTTSSIGQIEVEHVSRPTGKSGYTAKKLVSLWLNMFLNFSIAPLRAAVFLGLITSAFSILLLTGIVIDKIYINPNLTIGIPTVLVVQTLFAGVQLVVLGTIGEYLGRLFLDHSKRPQFVVRYCRERSEP